MSDVSHSIGRSNAFRSCPSDESRLQQDCYEAYNIQVAGLVQRLRAMSAERITPKHFLYLQRQAREALAMSV
jgi:hypothetical protein